MILNCLSVVYLPEFLPYLSQSSETEAATPHLPNGMKNMATTWYEGKVHSAGNLSCIVIA
jgi:hypothetical protein